MRAHPPVPFRPPLRRGAGFLGRRVSFGFLTLRIKLCSLCFLLLSLPLFLSAQTNSLTLDDLLQSNEQWANENFDDDALRVLKNAERQKIEQLFADIQKELQREFVIQRFNSFNDSTKPPIRLAHHAFPLT